MKGKLQELKNQVVNHPVYAILGGVLLAGAGFAAYKYFAGKNNKTKTPIEVQKSHQQIYKQVIFAVQQCISKNQALNGEVIKCIIRNQYKLAESQYKSFNLKMRTQRRKVMQKRNEYRKLILSMEVENDEIMDKNLNAILAHFNIDKNYWIENVELWSSDTEENKEEWQQLLISLQEEMSDALRNKSKSPLSFKKLSEIFKFKIQKLDNLDQSGIDFYNSTNENEQLDPTQKYVLIEKYIQDLVFNKFAVQEQDILFSQHQLSEQYKNKIYIIEDEFTQKIRTAIAGDENSQVQENVEGQSSSDSQSNDGDFQLEANQDAINKKAEQEDDDDDQYF